MRRPAKVLIGIILAAGIFVAGYAANRQPAPSLSSSSAKQAPSYTCPMHPQYTSDRPGDCPLCGMRLEPVTAEGMPQSAGSDTPGMVVVGAARQQLIGVRTDEVRRGSSSHVLRVPGRIAVDDQRLYRIVAAVDGWIVDLGQNTVGRFVKKDQLLASYYTSDLLATERLFLLSIPANEPLPTQAKDFSQASIRTAGSANPPFPIDSLRGLGMSDLQIEEIHRTRTASPHVNIYSPVSGFVLTRNISPSQRFDKGTELYRIADISRVWVMTDIFEKDRAVPEAGRGGHRPVSGPPAQGAHERRAAPVRRAVADAEDPFRARQPWPPPPARHVRGRGTRRRDAAGDHGARRRRLRLRAFARRCSSIAATGTSRPGAWRPAGGSATGSRSSRA